MVKVFKYIEALDCFVVEPNYKKLSDYLGLTEWNEVVWIGRFFLMDNDFGEHWFDNWDLRDSLEERAKEAGISYDDLLIIDTDRFKNGVDGPCHDEEERLLFWRDVLKSLELSYETLFAEARKENTKRKNHDASEHIPDLEYRIKKIVQDAF
jgi:hypothetical protein